MKIRANKETEIDQLVGIWYEGSLTAHDFIDKSYWETHRQEMKEKYIPMSETYVASVGQDVVGFVSMLDHYLAALFVDVKHQGEGYGKGLLDFIKGQKESIELKVYKKNSKAVGFYLKNGFAIKEESVDEQTSEVEFLMEWKKG
ncbi:GNAT family N-acetyltransferase [Edaphobacillus lindanitolerans]|uniref:Putative acetyltransferase n=1 Tax=Edaphobacillus lindanitolerans TaxID=550447 RepID=A0A1U7PSJ6_9BACI|nr:GNAT family N-acetyltransferase [Edaphobacillus lindanitolerans]SIT91156.1 putative acetyltransferase [Edaphobacillus lindanitolerans]